MSRNRFYRMSRNRFYRMSATPTPGHTSLATKLRSGASHDINTCLRFHFDPPSSSGTQAYAVFPPSHSRYSQHGGGRRLYKPYDLTKGFTKCPKEGSPLSSQRSAGGVLKCGIPVLEKNDGVDACLERAAAASGFGCSVVVLYLTAPRRVSCSLFFCLCISCLFVCFCHVMSCQGHDRRSISTRRRCGVPSSRAAGCARGSTASSTTSCTRCCSPTRQTRYLFFVFLCANVFCSLPLLSPLTRKRYRNTTV